MKSEMIDASFLSGGTFVELEMVIVVTAIEDSFLHTNTTKLVLTSRRLSVQSDLRSLILRKTPGFQV
jgi:hypothetical protein